MQRVKWLDLVQATTHHGKSYKMDAATWDAFANPCLHNVGPINYIMTLKGRSKFWFVWLDFRRSFMLFFISLYQGSTTKTTDTMEIKKKTRTKKSLFHKIPSTWKRYRKFYAVNKTEIVAEIYSCQNVYHSGACYSFYSLPYFFFCMDLLFLVISILPQWNHRFDS